MLSRSPVDGEAGTVTAEFAAVVPALLLVLGCCLGGMQLATAQLRLQDAASVSARSVARGDAASIGSVIAGAVAEVERRGDLLCVRASAPAPIAGGLFGHVTLEAASCALADGG